jgi:hypothetical protein
MAIFFALSALSLLVPGAKLEAGPALAQDPAFTITIGGNRSEASVKAKKSGAYVSVVVESTQWNSRSIRANWQSTEAVAT